MALDKALPLESHWMKMINLYKKETLIEMKNVIW